MVYENNALESASTSPFDKIRRLDHEQDEFWSARDLSKILGYTEYGKFKNALLKAQISCENSGYSVDDHFYAARAMIDLGSGAKRDLEDMHLSRYACYLVVQNADPEKEIVALGQTYFAIQARRQELADMADMDAMRTDAELEKLVEDEHRLILRPKIRHQNTDLASAAKDAGVVTSRDFGTFQNHGYRGLYNGLTAQGIHRRKGLKKSQDILDHMGAEELAANLFRSTQAEAKLRRDKVQGKDKANHVHHEAGQVVRRAIAELGGTMPENLPAVDSIKKLEHEQRKMLSAPQNRGKQDA